ncbi:hypothetical protein TCAP_03423 [Tolypocladium capitatum]|uniref:Uncharacterized protein n=1 Tax=Tolypocladium capitatum TaxID=45235 RepID=A0A2K3QGM2_9HYPO|nr:hypothetical protein TCAP_03423 [Tolypocladium capitatum]
MTPTWVSPAYPLLLTVPFAANLIDAADVSGHALSLNATAVALCAAATKGTDGMPHFPFDLCCFPPSSDDPEAAEGHAAALS